MRAVFGHVGRATEHHGHRGSDASRPQQSHARMTPPGTARSMTRGTTNLAAKNRDPFPTGLPLPRIVCAAEENDGGRAHSGGQVCGPGVGAYYHVGRLQQRGKLIQLQSASPICYTRPHSAVEDLISDVPIAAVAGEYDAGTMGDNEPADQFLPALDWPTLGRGTGTDVQHNQWPIG